MANRDLLIFDAHLDLSMNALEWNRDLTRPVVDIRKSEAGMDDKPDRAKGTVSLDAMRKGSVGICVATQIARYIKPGSKLPGWHSPHQAWAQTQGQLAWYNTMEEAGQMVQINDLQSLENHLKLWKDPLEVVPIGYILSLEGADSMITLKYVENAYKNGLRAIGPAHYGPGSYAQGTDASGGLGTRGRDLLKEMQRLNIILDATHLCDESFFEAMDCFSGNVWASHNNCRALVPHNRQFSDEQITILISRGAVIGAALDAWMLTPDWIRGVSTPESKNVTLANVADHIDHVCQLAGNSMHAAIGTDLDGAFGKEQCPSDLETIADLNKLVPVLEKRGYTPEDIANIMHKNWIRFLRKAWSK